MAVELSISLGIGPETILVYTNRTPMSDYAVATGEPSQAPHISTGGNIGIPRRKL
jgi:hypothetical protein